MEQKAGGDVKVPLAQQKSPVALNLANYLKDNTILKERTGLLNNKDDIDFFRYKRLIRALLSADYRSKQQNPKNGLPVIENEQDAQKVFIMLIQNQLLLPLEKLHFGEIKLVRGWKPNKSKPTLRRIEKATLDRDAYFGWIYSKPNPYILLYSVLALVGVFSVILFPLWPTFMKRGVWYLSMAALGVIGLFFLTAIIRLIIYLFSLVAFPKPFWLFPNLFEDCGVIESFQPLYGWEEPKKKKKSKKSKEGSVEAPAAASVEPSAKASGTTGGAPTGNGSANKRKVTIEEVED